MKNSAPAITRTAEFASRQSSLREGFLPKALAATIAVTAGSALTACSSPHQPGVGYANETDDSAITNDGAGNLAQEVTQTADGTSSKAADAMKADTMKADTTVADIMAATEVQMSSDDGTFDGVDDTTTPAEVISASDLGYIDPQQEKCQTVTYEECPSYKGVVSFKKICTSTDANGNPVAFTDPTCIQADCKPAPKDGCPQGTVCDPDGDGSFKFSKCN